MISLPTSRGSGSSSRASGISLHVWSAQRFLALVVFTCKAFDAEVAGAFTRDRFAMPEVEHRSF